MRTTRFLCSGLVTIGIAALLIGCQERYSAQPKIDSAIQIGGNDLGGVVTSANGPEAGVWVIAETADLPTRFIKIVVTDDRGRYLMPDLPKANYSVWARGYGLVDSTRVKGTPGKMLDLTAVVAPTAAAAAEYYPAIYWYSMLRVPEKNEFPLGKAASQAQWADVVQTNG